MTEKKKRVKGEEESVELEKDHEGALLEKLLEQLKAINIEENDILNLLQAVKSADFMQKLIEKSIENAYELVEKELRKKIELIQEKSDQIVVVTGQSGVGKGSIIKLLREEYQFIEPPFTTTRDLRDGEAEAGCKEVTAEDFLILEGTGKLFLAVSSYGNLYGYPIDVLAQMLNEGKRIVLESPPNRVASEVDFLLPKAVTLVVMPDDDAFTTESLKNRGTESAAKQKIRIAEGKADKAHCISLLGSSDVYPIIVVYGEEEHARQQVIRIFQNKLSKSGHRLAAGNCKPIEK